MQTAKISMSGIAVVSILHGYSRQRCMIDALLATAGLLVWSCLSMVWLLYVCMQCDYGCCHRLAQITPQKITNFHFRRCLQGLFLRCRGLSWVTKWPFTVSRLATLLQSFFTPRSLIVVIFVVVISLFLIKQDN